MPGLVLLLDSGGGSVGKRSKHEPYHKHVYELRSFFGCSLFCSGNISKLISISQSLDRVQICPFLDWLWGRLYPSFSKLSKDPFFGTLDALDDVHRFLLKESVPVGFFSKDSGVANDDEAVLCSRDAHIDTVLILDEHTGGCAHHRHEDQVEFTALRTINREDLVVNLALSKILSDGVLLCVVGRDHVHRVLRKLHHRPLRILLAQGLRVFESLKAEVFKFHDHVDLAHVVIRGSFLRLDAFWNIDE
eukprot:CAMPEP_0185599180 /NCGR_PEP_ID=MMETSP0434-20130131/82515_1 /TAXON_ID=626734 ORGANISM="Favella taraikaensis, Strain Fe Narragansett Bay" /NCGR_SAMPLE_ID=MMETSP0434 /ASSEMBLY_ACC=CAM_ASM_000379 /LENGTH=246 /DNA_ID=CAMNT_0028228461 /DNA_START=101 /DNA_END=841 /DNA_ORIENTATION=-